jgi:hypothetical protein
VENLVQPGDAGGQPLRGFLFWHGVLLVGGPPALLGSCREA